MTSKADRDLAARALDALNGGKTCRKCGASSEAVDKNGFPQTRSNNRLADMHSMSYNKATDMLDMCCWRCGYTWSAIPDDRKELT